MEGLNESIIYISLKFNSAEDVVGIPYEEEALIQN